MGLEELRVCDGFGKLHGGQRLKEWLKTYKD